MGNQERFAKLCWDDINNGCAHVKFSLKQWQDHFAKKHPESADILISMLLDAYVEYEREVKGKFAL